MTATTPPGQATPGTATTPPGGIAGDSRHAALPAEVDVAIVGGGFSGLAMAIRLRRAGRDDFVVLERGEDVGGTWRDNTYPGCACDVPSHVYSFSFAPNPDWSSTFSAQPEILAYLRRVAEEEGVLPSVRCGAEVTSAAWDEESRRWQVTTVRGTLRARVLVAAAGPLSEPSIPALPGLDRFRGTIFHSAAWRHDHDLRGRRVAVVGTGASAVQIIPEIQPAVDRLVVFQRTPAWVMPRRARPLTRLERAAYRRFPATQRAMRAGIAAVRELYAFPLLHAALSPATRRLARLHLAAQVRDPELRAKLTPTFAPGCKRVLISNDYYPALGRPNVEVVAGGVTELRERSLVSDGGVEHEVDTVIFATGFHVTDMPIAERVRGRGGVTLAERWQGSLSAHRGTTVAAFPNLFLLLGPNTGLGHTSVVIMAEAQVGYVLEALRAMDARGAEAVEVRAEVERGWNERVQRAMRGTVWTDGGCASWYLDRTGRNSTLWPGYTVAFRRQLRRFDVEGYTLLPPAPVPLTAGADRVAVAA